MRPSRSKVAVVTPGDALSAASTFVTIPEDGSSGSAMARAPRLCFGSGINAIWPLVTTPAADAPGTKTTAARTRTRARALRLRRDVGGSQAAVDEERRRVHVRGLVAREEERRIHDLARLRHPPHRHVDEPAFRSARRLAPDAEQQRRLNRSRAQRVDSHALPRKLHAELLA